MAAAVELRVTPRIITGIKNDDATGGPAPVASVESAHAPTPIKKLKEMRTL